MKIVYNKNPLHTQVFLDEHEKKEFWLKIKIEELEHQLFGAHFHLTEKDFCDIERAKQESDPKYYWADDGEKPLIDKRVDTLYNCFIENLEHNPHGGDCTCVACSCSKCQAESLLKIDTMPGLGKHEAHKIQGAFILNGETKWGSPQRSIEEAIETLSHYKCEGPPPWEGAEAHYPRWEAETERAHKWLINYRDLHFSNHE